MRIVNFGQIIDLEGGKRIAHQITVELDTGLRRQVQTDEGTVQQLLDIITEKDEQQSFSPQPPDDMEPDEGQIFGGGYAAEDYDAVESGEYVPESVMGVMADEPAASVPVTPGGLGHPPVDTDGYYLPPKAKTVPKDEMGYPVVQRQAAPDDVDDEEDGDQI